MVSNSSLVGPYAPARNVLDVIHRMRDRGLPEVIDSGILGAIGVPDGNQPRTLAALKFLGLVDEENRRTELLSRLGRGETREEALARFREAQDRHERIDQRPLSRVLESGA